MSKRQRAWKNIIPETVKPRRNSGIWDDFGECYSEFKLKSVLLRGQWCKGFDFDEMPKAFPFSSSKALRRRAKRLRVIKYARARNWQIGGLPQRGAYLDILSELIEVAEHQGWHLGRWGKKPHSKPIYGLFKRDALPPWPESCACRVKLDACEGTTYRCKAGREMLEFKEKVTEFIG